MNRYACPILIGTLMVFGVARAEDSSSTYHEEKSVTSPSGTTKSMQHETTSNSTTGSQTTQSSSSYTVKSVEPGKSITLVGPDGAVTNYSVTTQSTMPTDISAGRKVTIETVPGSSSPTIQSMRYYESTTTAPPR